MFPTFEREAFSLLTWAENFAPIADPAASSSIEAIREPVERRLRDF
jgi:hypothetical protein